MIQRKIMILVCLAIALVACGPKKPALTPLQMWITIQPDASANSGKVFWMVIKEVDENQFANDTYDRIESTFLAEDWGPDVLGVFPVVPGTERRITITRPTFRHAGFYFLFTEPREYWKVILKQPIGTNYDLRIEEYKASVSRRMSAW